MFYNWFYHVKNIRLYITVVILDGVVNDYSLNIIITETDRLVKEVFYLLTIKIAF